MSDPALPGLPCAPFSLPFCPRPPCASAPRAALPPPGSPLLRSAAPRPPTRTPAPSRRSSPRRAADRAVPGSVRPPGQAGLSCGAGCRGAADGGHGLGTPTGCAALSGRRLGSARGFPGVPGRGSLGAPGRSGANCALGEGRGRGWRGSTSATGKGTSPSRDSCPGNLCSPGTQGRLGRGVQLQVVGALDPAQEPCHFFVRASPSQAASALQLPAVLPTPSLQASEELWGLE